MSTLKRKRSRSRSEPPRAPTFDDEVDYCEHGDDCVDVELANKVRAVIFAGETMYYQCRICSVHHAFLREIPSKWCTTWICQHCLEKQWDAYQTTYEKKYDDYWDDATWADFCRYVHERVRVRPPQGSVRAE